jgi:UDP-2,3-diacylglucosamine pyrophosphatase LpxH
MSTDYYFISDMHIGGDGALRDCDFMDELLAFLQELEQLEGDAELIINGDAFGLWEFTSVEGMAKLETLIDQQRDLFEQFKATGLQIKITLMAGNHDYELACYPEFIDRLKDFNVDLVPEIEITREVAGKKIWIEHGMQHDENNRMPDFGNPYAQPFGYHITSRIVGTAGKVSDFGKDNWLKDIQSVASLKDIPSWMTSNYFYKEMGTLLRYLLLPFLLLFGLSVLTFAAGMLEKAGVVDFNIITGNRLFLSLGSLGDLLAFIFAVNGVVLTFLLLLAVPLYFVIRDFRSALSQYNLMETDETAAQMGEDKGPYVRAAQKVFRDQPEVSIFIFGHTHRAFLEKKTDGRVILNTGTWLKLFDKIPVLLGYLPAVYYPRFQMSSYKITEEEGSPVIYYREIPKKALQELSWLQRLLTLGRSVPQPESIPERTVVEINS